MKKLVLSIVALLLAGSSSLALAQQNASRQIKINHKYLNIPVSEDDNKQLTMSVKDGEPLTVSVSIAESEPAYWVFRDVSDLKGKTLKLEYTGSKKALSKLYCADTLVGQSQLYKEANRPQYHFTTMRGWTNDPNGLVYHNGEYHLYYQYNPYERNWGNMHWGHAVSRDLIHWEELPTVLFPDKFGTMFSGSAVYDAANTSGFGTAENPPLVYLYTAHARWQTQCLAYSLDNGRTLIKYDGNPVIDSHEACGSHETRDPKVFWYEPEKHWVMVLYERNGNTIYTSKDLKSWTWRSHTEGFEECPDLFCLAIDGNPNNTKWVMTGASGTYLVGDFDGYKFTPISGKHHYVAGSMYAFQTYSNITDGRCIQIGWGQIDHPGMPFRSQMTIPTELSLCTTKDGLRVKNKPVREINRILHRKYTSRGPMTSEQAKEALKPFADCRNLHIRARIQMVDGPAAGFRYGGTDIFFYSGNRNTINGWFYAPQDLESMTLETDIYIDQTSVEVFMEDGLFCWSAAMPEAKEGGVFEFIGGLLSILELNVDEVESIW